MRQKLILSNIDCQNGLTTLDVNALEESSNEKEDDWRIPFIKMRNGWVPEDRAEKISLFRRAASYQLINGEFFRLVPDKHKALLLRCLSPQEASKVMKEVHQGLCGAHQSGPKMKIAIKNKGFF